MTFDHSLPVNQITMEQYVNDQIYIYITWFIKLILKRFKKS